MNARNKKNGGGLTLVEAVETLSSIADLEVDPHIGIVSKHEMTIQDRPVSYRSVDWLQQQSADETVKMVKEVFLVILNYLKDFYRNEYRAVKDEQTLEGIKTIMVLVGEAAKKLDKYTALFHLTQEKSVTELKEYKQLQELYHNRIARKVDEGMLVQWIYALSRKAKADKGVKLVGKVSNQVKHVYVDLESVKKDIEYELFFIRKEDGSRFFSPRLVRNLKLVNDFGSYFAEETVGSHPLVSLADWPDKYAYACAGSLLRTCRVHIERFYRRALQHKDNELVEALNKALLALYLCAQPNHLSGSEASSKTCSNYFCDFQMFLRQALHSRDYQHMVTYPPRKSSKLALTLLHLTQALCMSLYTQLTGLHELLPSVRDLIIQSEEKRSLEHVQACAGSHSLADKLAEEYAAMAKLVKNNPDGPINKILTALQDGEYRVFDPLMQGNIPSELYTLYVQDCKSRIMRWPSPTHQEFIHKCSVVDEFKAFLHACNHGHAINKNLLINMQDRTSWKDHFRCMALEDLPHHESYVRHLEVISLAKDTEFYHQQAPYHLENHADIFMQLYKEQLLDEGCGYQFPDHVKKILAEQFIPRAMEGVHRIFFNGKNVLTRDQRLDFIEIFSLLLQLKVIDIAKPDVVGFTCKDGIDLGEAVACELYVFLKLLAQERMSENDRQLLDVILHGPSLLFRGRLMQPERFNRMLSTIKTLESAKSQLGHEGFVKEMDDAFGKLYTMPMLHAKPVSSRSKDIL